MLPTQRITVDGIQYTPRLAADVREISGMITLTVWEEDKVRYGRTWDLFDEPEADIYLAMAHFKERFEKKGYLVTDFFSKKGCKGTFEARGIEAKPVVS